jgi:phosphatidylinositol alpha-1,6-mannosyltransferase
MIGADGVSAVSRQIVTALTARLGRGLDAVDVWSLADPELPAGLEAAGLRFRTARSSRVGFAAFGFREPDVDANTLAIVLHAHLLPVALPLVGRGARLVTLLLGIEGWKPLTRLEAAALRRAWKVAAISRHTTDRFREANPAFSSRPIEVCHPGVPEAVDPSRRIGSPADTPYALIVGRMASNERYKGHDELLDVWAKVMASAPGARLVVAGGGDDLHRLREKASALGLTEHVTFTGRVTDEQLASLYRDAAFLVMPSRDEGFGLVYLEAMRAGKPCVAARGAAEEIIEHESSGIIVDQGNDAELAAAIVRLFTDPAERKRMGHAATAQVAERFSKDHFAARLYDLLEISVTRAPGPGVRADQGIRQGTLTPESALTPDP